MKKIKVILFLLAFYPYCSIYGQIPSITILPSGTESESVLPHIFKGEFYVDSIRDIGNAFLIDVTCVDSLETNSPGLSSLTLTKAQFTIISMKQSEKQKGETIHEGGTYRFTLSPPEGIWTIYGDKINDWRYSQSFRDSADITTNVPLPLIKTQLMLSSELIDLNYIENNVESNKKCIPIGTTEHTRQGTSTRPRMKTTTN